MAECVEWLGRDGLKLVGDVYGDAHAFPVVLLHGGGQTRHAWGETGRALAEAGFYAVCLDQRGHGESEWATDGDYRVDAFAADLTEITKTFARAPVVVGASLGGMAALIASAACAEALFAAIVLVDIAPRIEVEGVTRIISFMRAKPDGFASLEEAADAVAELPHRPRPKDLSGLAKNLRLGDDGRYRWHWDPRFITPTRMKGPSIAHQRLSEAARTLTIPTLLVRGRMSDVISEESAKELLELVPHAELVDVASAAHMVAGDRNDRFTGAVVDFLARFR